MLASHRTFAIPEVLHRIFSEFGPISRPGHFTERSTYKARYDSYSHFPSGGRDTLAKAARCCKSFAVVALDILWSAQASVVPLLSILPAFKKKSRIYTLNNKIRSASWKRVEYYARRIRYLDSCSRVENIDEFVFVFLAQHLKDKPLMPSLHTLSYPISPEIFLLITPHLRRVNVKDDTSGSSLFLHTLLEKAPSIERVASTATFNSAALAILAKFTRLRYLNTGDNEISGSAFLKTVLGFHHLMELHVCLPEFDTKLEFSNGAALPALRTLFVEGNGASIHDTLGLLNGSPLASLTIIYDVEADGSREDNWRLRLMTVAQWPNTLQFLELEDYDAGDDNENPINPSILDPLLRVANLRHFHLKSSPPIKFTNAYLWKMAKAWPKIEHVVLSSFATFADASEEPLATVASLEAFATHCPSLQSMSLRLYTEATLEPIPRVLLTHRLQRLWIDSPMSGDHTLIARHLVALFPYLRDVGGDDEDADKEEYDWADVASMVEFFRATTQDNKRREQKLT